MHSRRTAIPYPILRQREGLFPRFSDAVALYITRQLFYHTGMLRSCSTDVLILAHRKRATRHRHLVLLSREFGMIEAVAYGAKQGSLTGKIGQFVSGTCYLYRNPVRDSWKVEDMVPMRYRPYLMDSIELLYTASFISECIMKTYAGGGEHANVLNLAEAALDALEEPRNREVTVIQFLWRLLEDAGFMQDSGICASCGRDPGASEPLYLERDSLSLVCSSCGDSLMRGYAIGPGSRAYIRRSRSLPVSEAVRIGLEAESLRELKGLLICMADAVTEGSLKTLSGGLV